MGLHPGPDLDVDATAALTGTTTGQPAQLLDRLARASLIQPPGQGGYGMRDLLGVYAGELANAEESAQGREAALSRLFDHYLEMVSGRG